MGDNNDTTHIKLQCVNSAPSKTSLQVYSLSYVYVVLYIYIYIAFICRLLYVVLCIHILYLYVVFCICISLYICFCLGAQSDVKIIVHYLKLETKRTM